MPGEILELKESLREDPRFKAILTECQGAPNLNRCKLLILERLKKVGLVSKGEVQELVAKERGCDPRALDLAWEYVKDLLEELNSKT